MPSPSLARRNLFALMVDVTGFCIGLAFLDGSAVLPLLMTQLGGSGLLIGAFATLRILAFGVTQIFVAYVTQSLPRQKPPLAWVAGITRLPLIALPFVLYHAADSPTARAIALYATISLMSIWALGDGLGYVPWMEIVARSFSEKTRGRFFSSTQIISGIVGVLTAALLVRPILAATFLPFPHNYALLALAFTAMMLVSLVGVLLIHEPPAPKRDADAKRIAIGDYFRRLPVMLRENPTFTRLSNIEILIAFGSASQPFYVLEARSRFHLADSWGGIYQTLLAVSIVAMMPIWAWLSEKRGSHLAVRGVALCCLLTPVFALSLGRLSPWLYGLVFLMMGGSQGFGMWIVINHYLLTHVEETERPTFIGLLNLRSAPAAFFPLLGGLFVSQTGLLKVADIPILFVLTAFVVAIGFGLALRLPSPQTTA